jgi:tetratricopeptide (TPR) repeat protein
MREMRYESVAEIVRYEMKQGDYISALRKIRWHQHQQPDDPEGFWLEGQILEALNSPENAIIAYKKSFSLKKSRGIEERILKLENILQQRKNELNVLAAEILPTETTTEAIPENSIQTPAPDKTPEKTPAPLADMAILSKMRGLEALISLYKSKIGPMETFSLDSLRKQKVLTRETDFSELGELSLKNGEIHSSIFGNITDIDQSLDFFRSAIKEEQEGKTEKAFTMLWEKRLELGAGCLDYLIMLCEKLNYPEKIIELKERLARMRPHDFINIYELAMYYYKKNRTKEALKWFHRLRSINSPYQAAAEEKITELEKGGSWELKHKFLEQKRQLFNQKAPESLNPVSE